jgi:transcription elongation factor GreB
MAVDRPPNYITPEGAKKLQEELHALRAKERPKIVQDVADAAAQGDRSENAEYIYGKKKLREIDRRIHFLIKRLESAHVVHPESRTDGRVYFGAWVDVEDEDGARASYRIVGADETEPGSGSISWQSPLGRTLLKRKAGDVVTFKKPSGDVELTILGVRYEPETKPGPDAVTER